MKKKILITGGLGLIGKSLTQILLKDYKVIIIDKTAQIKRHKNYIKLLNTKGVKFITCDIINKKKLVKTFDKIDCVVHLAALLGVKNTENNKNLCWKINTEGTQNVVDVCLAKKVKKLIFSSSSEVYGEQITKKKINEKNPLLGLNIYALSKIAAENYIKIMLRESNTKYTILRFFNTYGEGQVAQFFISKLCYSAINNKLFVINGNGKQVRSYGHSNDVVLGIKKCIEKSVSNNKIYNIGNSNEVYSLKKVVSMASQLSKIKIKILFNKRFKKGDRIKKREIFQRICDIKKAKKEISYDPKISLKEGLKKVLDQKIIYRNWPHA